MNDEMCCRGAHAVSLDGAMIVESTTVHGPPREGDWIVVGDSTKAMKIKDIAVTDTAEVFMCLFCGSGEWQPLEIAGDMCRYRLSPALGEVFGEIWTYTAMPVFMYGGEFREMHPENEMTNIITDGRVVSLADADIINVTRTAVLPWAGDWVMLGEDAALAVQIKRVVRNGVSPETETKYWLWGVIIGKRW